MFEDFLNDRCDIYHARETTETRGFGIPDGTAIVYGEEPDAADVPCHFNRANAGGLVSGVSDSPPFRQYMGEAKVQFPVTTDVRVNDRIVHRETGCSYTASVPYVVGRGHHIAVMAVRLPVQERL